MRSNLIAKFLKKGRFGMEIAEIEKQKEEKKKKKKKGVIAGVVLATSLAVTAGVTGAVLSRGGRKEEYYIYFNVGESTIEKISNTDIEIPQAPTQAGYEFEGWYEGDSDTPFDFENPPLDRNVTLTARYNRQTYNISYISNDGTIEDEAVTTYTVEDENIDLPTNVTRDGYTFGGWYASEDFSGENVATIAKGSTGNKVFYAKWTAGESTKYTVEYYFENLANSGYTLDDTMTKEECGTTDTKTTVTASEVEGFDLQEITQQNIDRNGKAVVEVYYKRHVYTATLNAGKGIASISLSGVGVSGTSVKYGATVTVSATLKTGYTNLVLSSSEFTQGTSAVTVSASATAIEYTVTYNYNNDNSEVKTDTYTVESEDISLQTPTRAGYIFDGWLLGGTKVTTISSDTVKNISGGGLLYTQIGLKHLCILMTQRQ